MTIAEFRVLHRKLSFETLDQLYKAFREVLGPKTAEQVLRFKGELAGAQYSGSAISRLQRSSSLTSVRLITSLRLLCAQPSTTWNNRESHHFAYIEAFLVDCWSDTCGFDNDRLFSELSQYCQYVSRGDTSLLGGLLGLLSSYKATLVHRLRPLALIILGKAIAVPLSNPLCHEIEENLGSVSQKIGELIFTSQQQMPNSAIGNSLGNSEGAC